MITGRTPAAANRALRAVLQQAVSCVNVGVLTADTSRVTTELLVTSRLVSASGGPPLTLSIEHRYSMIHQPADTSRHPWHARTVGYLYTLDDADGHEILAYHWHPSGRSPVMLPHLHLGAGAGALRDELTKAHLETAFVTPVALLQLMIEQFGVRPRRADWTAVLEQARHALDAG